MRMTYIQDVLGLSEEDRLEVKNTLFNLFLKRNDLNGTKGLGL